ncbi:hypothetical protein N8215_03190 [Flavobacteriaceae bacterium]|nr:hypothetical protein [Flavobacteriaceae bacterium]
MKILDCTLRDGGYYTNWDFNQKLINSYIEATNILPIDIIEVGYRSNKQTEYLGEYFYCPLYVLKDIRKKSVKKIAIMLNEKDVSIADASDLLKPIVGLVDLVRLAVDPKNLKRALKLALLAKEMGFKVAFNAMYMSKWTEQPDFINGLNQLDGKVDYFNMVDSYGGVFPSDVIEIYNLVSSKTNVKIGFHGHNNLELGLINTITAIDCGSEIVDATITGMGRGAGNLKTELLLTVLKAKGSIEVEFNTLSKVVDDFLKLQNEYEWGTNLPYMVSGANSLPQKEVMEWVGKRFYSYNSIIRALTNQSKGLKDNMNLPTLDLALNFKKAIIIGGGPTGTSHSKALLEYLHNNNNIVIIHVSSKNVNVYKGLGNKQIHCLAGNEGHRLEKAFQSETFSNRIAILPPYPRAMGTYVPIFFSDNAYQLPGLDFTNVASESVTAIAIQTALNLGITEIQFAGYDGYHDQVSTNEMELFAENETIFSQLKNKGILFCSLTPTRYTELPSSSIYSLL